MRQQLQPGKFAVVAEIQEDWTTPVDTRMEAIGGKVFRRALSEVKHAVNEEDVHGHESRPRGNEGRACQGSGRPEGEATGKDQPVDFKIQAHEKSKQRRQAAVA